MPTTSAGNEKRAPSSRGETVTNERRTIHYRGHVQGVGFRYTTRQVAEQFSVSGTVCNLDDGSVRVIAEGSRGELDRFLDAVSQAMEGRIRGQSEEIGPPTGEFSGFSIVHH